jgi:hypothetical protein
MIQSIKAKDVYFQQRADKGKGKGKEKEVFRLGEEVTDMTRGLNEDIDGETGLSYLFVITGDNEVNMYLDGRTLADGCRVDICIYHRRYRKFWDTQPRI